MSTLLDRMKSLMDQNGIKPTQMTTILGISSSSFTDWGKGKGNPSLMTVVKFAEYFNVSLDYLVHGKELSSPKLEDSNSIDKELIDKFHALAPEYRMKIIMLSVLPAVTDESNK